MQIQVLQAVIEQQIEVAILQLLAGRHVGEIDERPVERQRHRDQDVLAAPLRGHRLGREVLRGLGTVALDVAAQRAEIRSEVGQDLAQAGLGKLGAVEGAKAAVDVVEAVAELVQLAWGEAERVGVVADPPQSSPDLGRRAHAWKLASCLAARTTVANSAVSVAAPSTSIGARSSRRVLVPNSHARAVLPS